MAASHQANRCQQLQNQSFGPENTQVHLGVFYFESPVSHQCGGFVGASPRVSVVQAQRDLVHTAGVLHDEVEPGLKTQAKRSQQEVTQLMGILLKIQPLLLHLPDV